MNDSHFVHFATLLSKHSSSGLWLSVLCVLGSSIICQVRNYQKFGLGQAEGGFFSFANTFSRAMHSLVREKSIIRTVPIQFG